MISTYGIIRSFSSFSLFLLFLFFFFLFFLLLHFEFTFFYFLLIILANKHECMKWQYATGHCTDVDSKHHVIVLCWIGFDEVLRIEIWQWINDFLNSKSVTWSKKIILLLGGNFPSFTSRRYFTIALIFPYKPWRAWTFRRILLESEFKEIYLIYLSKCSTPISSGSVA